MPTLNLAVGRVRQLQRMATVPKGTFEVIHPHHPLRGQSFKLVTYRHNWGEDRVYFHDSRGVLRFDPSVLDDSVT